MMIAQQHASTADAAATSPEALRSLAEYLTRARLATRLTFRDVCDRTGIPLGYLSRLEAGQVREPSPRALWRLAHVYGADYAALMRLAGDVGAAPGTVPGLDELTPDDRMEIVGIIQLKLRRYRHGSSRTRSQTGSQRTRRRATPPDTFVDEAAAALTKLHAAYTAPALPHPGRALGYIRLDRAGLAGRAALNNQAPETLELHSSRSGRAGRPGGSR